MAFEVACSLGDAHQLGRHVGADTGFVRDDFGFDVVFGVVEVQRAKTLFGRLLEVFHQALVARVVGDDDLKIGVGLHQLALLLQGQNTAVVGQGVDHHGGVLTRLNNLIEVTNRAMASGHGQRAVLPAGAVGVQQEAAHQVAGGHVLVAGHGDQGLVQLPGHVLDKAGFAAAGGAFEHHGHAHRVGGFEQLDFVGHRAVIRFLGDAVGVQCFAHVGLHRSGLTVPGAIQWQGALLSAAP